MDYASMNESEQHTTILSNNRVSHNVFLALVPVVTVWGGFAVLILTIGMIVFFLTDQRGFLAFMPSIFTGAIYAIGATITLVLLSLMIKYVLGGFVKHVISGWVQEVAVPWRQSRVPFGNENFAV